MQKESSKKKPLTKKRSEQVCPPIGFGKTINEYLNQYVAIADAKAGAIIAANVVTITLLASIIVPNKIFGITIFIAVVLFSISTVISTMVIYPRIVRNDVPGVIFWEDIRTFKNFDEYFSKLQKFDLFQVEREYASQNFTLSNILRTKHRFIRLSIILSSLGIALSFIAYWFTN